MKYRLGKTTGIGGGVLVAALSALLPTDAEAQTCPTYTYTLTNGTTADASQVMSNFNTVRNCANTLASGGTLNNTGLTGTTYVNGSLGIGTASPDWILDIQQNQNYASRMQLVNASTGNVALADLRISNGTNYTTVTHYGTNRTTSGIFRQDGGLLYSPGAGGLTVATGAAQPIHFAINESEKMRLDTSGRLLLNTTSVLGSAETLSVLANNPTNPAALFKQTAYAAPALSIWNSDTSGNNHFVRFYTESGATQRGSITYNRTGGLVEFSTTSDYRTKELFGDFTGSGAIVDAVPVHMGRMKGATMARPMFVAHEVQAHMPWAVTGEKDAVDADGNIVAQQLNESAMIATLWAETRALRSEVRSLRKRVKELETEH